MSGPAAILAPMPAGCELATAFGSACDVMAVGRCSECGKAFCGSHQAIRNDATSWGRFVDWCTACQHRSEQQAAAAAAAAAQARREQLAASAERRRVAWEEIGRRGFDRFAAERAYQWFPPGKKKPRRMSAGFAIPVGDLVWVRAWRTDDESEGSRRVGLDRDGNLVDMASTATFDPRHDLIRNDDLDAVIADALEGLLAGGR